MLHLLTARRGSWTRRNRDSEAGLRSMHRDSSRGPNWQCGVCEATKVQEAPTNWKRRGGDGETLLRTWLTRAFHCRQSPPFRRPSRVYIEVKPQCRWRWRWCLLRQQLGEANLQMTTLVNAKKWKRDQPATSRVGKLYRNGNNPEQFLCCRLHLHDIKATSRNPGNDLTARHNSNVGLNTPRLHATLHPSHEARFKAHKASERAFTWALQRLFARPCQLNIKLL